MITKYFEIKGGPFSSVHFGLEEIAKLKTALPPDAITGVTLAFAKERGYQNPLEGKGYYLSGIPLEQLELYASLIGGREPALFHLKGPTIDLVVVQQKVTNIDSYHIDDVYNTRPRQDGSGNVVVSQEGYGIKPKEDYVEGHMGLVEGANPKDFSKLEEAIRKSCTFIKDEAAEQLYHALKNSTKEAPVPASMLSGK